MASFPKDADIPMPLPAVFDWLVTNRPDCVMPVGMMRQLALTPGNGFRALVLPGGTMRKRRVYVRPADVVKFATQHTIE